MSNYNETITEGSITKYLRAEYFVGYNTFPPKIEYHEQERTILPDGQELNEPKEKLVHIADDMTLAIPFVNSETYEPTDQTFTAEQFYQMATAVYLYLARNRDAEQARILAEKLAREAEEARMLAENLAKEDEELIEENNINENIF